MQIESDRPLPTGAHAWIKDKARLAFGTHVGEIRRIRIQLRQVERSGAVVTVLCGEVRTVVTEKAAGDPLSAYSQALDQASRKLKSRLRLRRAAAGTEVS